MNRCLHSLSRKSLAWRMGLFTALFAFFSLAPAQEGVRNFPPNARRGVMLITDAPAMLLNGRAARLAPGARIRGVNNMLVVSNAVAGQPLVVNYVRGYLGLVQEVWVLNATEAQQPMPSDVSSANYMSNFAPPPVDGTASADVPAVSYKN